MRLNKFIAQAGVCSRRQADELIKSGAIKVNGKIIRELGTVIDELKDEITFGKRKLGVTEQKAYLAVNKPVGYITSASSSQGKSVADLVKDIKARVYPIGRLDKDSSGLVLMTDDGDFAYRLTQAKFGIEKEYEVLLDKPLSLRDRDEFERGMVLDDKKLRPVRVASQHGNRVNLVLRQGVNRQIRRMAEQLKYRVVELKRVRMGKYRLGDLKEGRYVRISPEDVI